MIEALCEANKREFSFEEAANPTVPNCRVIFEFGLADGEEFTFIDRGEADKALNFLAVEQLDTADFFCAIRYYKGGGGLRRALKFDYYLIRTLYGRSLLEVQVYHKQGMRYISPEDLALFIANHVNETLRKQVLKPHLSGDETAI